MVGKGRRGLGAASMGTAWARVVLSRSGHVQTYQVTPYHACHTRSCAPRSQLELLCHDWPPVAR